MTAEHHKPIRLFTDAELATSGQTTVIKQMLHRKYPGGIALLDVAALDLDTLVEGVDKLMAADGWKMSGGTWQHNIKIKGAAVPPPGEQQALFEEGRTDYE